VNLVACNLLRWQHMMLMVLRATDDVSSKIFVEYEALVREPLTQARRLATFLDEHRGGARPNERSIRAMAEAVDPSFWRNRSDRCLSEVAEATTEQQRLYDFLRDKIVEPAKEFADAYPMPPGWWAFVHNREAVVRAHAQCAENGSQVR
jgi:hypothetical protein